MPFKAIFIFFNSKSQDYNLIVVQSQLDYNILHASVIQW